MIVDFKSLVDAIVASVLKPLVPVVFMLIFAYFFYGVAVYILHGDNPEKRKDGYDMIKYGVLAIFIAASIWGILTFLMLAFGF